METDYSQLSYMYNAVFPTILFLSHRQSLREHHCVLQGILSRYVLRYQHPTVAVSGNKKKGMYYPQESITRIRLRVFTSLQSLLSSSLDCLVSQYKVPLSLS